MSFKKLGEAIEITNIVSEKTASTLVSEEILEQFKKQASELKKLAPKANDFLYFSAVMMHSAEASGVNDDGSPKLTRKGEKVEVGWDKTGGTWKWQSNDPGIKPYKNSNGDIFPEEELLKAYKKWVHKPLCIDHKSSSVDHVRGFIVDTYYDFDRKRVIALCALDKKNYPDLAFKVSSGYSNCVSMGTAVGKAICTEDGCHRVARVESDFCNHMKTRTCYGEINVDLSPIELSIVVNGADGKAKIKHIIAAANALNKFVDDKNQYLQSVAEKTENFNATIKFNASDTDNSSESKGTELSINSDNLEDFQKALEEAIGQLKELKEDALSVETKDESEQDVDLADGFAAATKFTPSSVVEDAEGISLQTPGTERLAHETLVEEFKKIASHIEVKINDMKEGLNLLINKEETTMSGNKKEIDKKAYYLGTEEPTPGQVKYTKDPMNEKLRDEDKHMVGQMDTGPVDGMHPGPDSVSMSELDRKKMLARAQKEEGALRRGAVVQAAKEALGYFQGGGGVNEPTPGKVKYPADKAQEKIREDEDKHMTGQSPFPGVGDVNGLHPSPASADEKNELKRKEMLARASDKLVASFEKGVWSVYHKTASDKKLLLTASVSDIAKSLGQSVEEVYGKVATKDFASTLIGQVKALGADATASLYKVAQAAPAEEATTAEGDPKDTAMKLAEKMRDLSSDLIEALKMLTGEQAEMGDVGAELGGMAATASEETKELLATRTELNGDLAEAIKEVVAELQTHEEELGLITDMYASNSINETNQDMASGIVSDAFTSAQEAFASGFQLMQAFVRYAQATETVIKRAELEAELTKTAGLDELDFGADDSENDLMSMIDEGMANTVDDTDELMGDDMGLENLELNLDDLAADDDNDADVKLEEAKKLDPSAKPGEMKVNVVAFNTPAGRAQLRAKFAAEMKFSPMLDQAHPKGGFTTELDVKPSGDLAKVEELAETHKAMLDLANAPPKVRKEAEEINELVKAGSLDPSDLDELVSMGLDKDAVSYWKKYFGQVDGGGEFASELVKEHAKAKFDAELAKEKVKLARCYELAYEFVDRGLLARDREVIASQVNEFMGLNDKGFEQVKIAVCKHPVKVSVAGVIPQIGLTNSGESVSGSEDNLFNQLSDALSTSNRRMF